MSILESDHDVRRAEPRGNAARLLNLSGGESVGVSVRAAAVGAVAALAMYKLLLPDHRILSAVVKA